MRFQSHASSCGPASASNALSALGIARSEEECSTLCGTTATDGTDPRGLITGLKQIPGCSPAWIREQRGDVAILRLVASLRIGRPVILCVDGYEHWVAAVGLLGDRIIVVDSADADLALSYSAGEALERWEGESRPAFIGLVL